MPRRLVERTRDESGHIVEVTDEEGKAPEAAATGPTGPAKAPAVSIPAAEAEGKATTTPRKARKRAAPKRAAKKAKRK